MSGVVLLTIVFYLNPTLYLIAPGSDLAPAAAIAIGIGSLVCGWFVYTILCDSALGKTPALLGLVLFVLLVAAAYGLTQVFSGRGAYLHVGAIIGTIMVGNVFRVIMPAQRALVKAIEENREPDPVLPAKGLLRSRHNNYFTLPVLFIMISNQQASAPLASTPAAAPAQPATGGDAPAAPAATQASNAGAASGADFDKVHHVIQERCTVCHSAKPTSQLFSTAPGGIMLDTPQQIQQLAPKIQAQAVASQIMPLGNITQMTQEERNLIGSWIAKGAQIN